MTRSFILLCCFCLVGVSGTDMVKEVSVMEGESVTLHSNVTEVQRNDDIRWSFGAEGALLAFIDDNDISLPEVSEGRFKGRLQLDPQTGFLTINNITKTHSGPYQLTIRRGEINQVNKFNLIVFSCLPDPVIIRNSSQCSFSSFSLPPSNCSVVCSVVNVSAVSLSWYKGNSLLSSISVSDLSISLSLPLEVEYQENNNYSCVINNTISNQTTHLVINTICQPCSDPVTLIILLSAAAGTLLILAVLVIICFYRNNRKTAHKAETHAEEITYADPTFHKRKAPKPRTEEVTYSDPKLKKSKAPKSNTEDITYADPNFYKRKAPKSRLQEEPDVVYAGVAVRR